MKHKRAIIFLSLALVLVFSVAGGLFYWNNLRGIGPAIKPAPQDIAEIIDNNNEESASVKIAQNTTGLPLNLPEGFDISIFAKNLVTPRVIKFDPKGTMVVSTLKDGKVVALPDKNKDGKADEVIILAEGLNSPHGLEFYQLRDQIKLYVGEIHQVSAYDYDPATFKISNRQKIADLPQGGGHFTRTLLFTEDNKLLISVGSSCNVCRETNKQRASVLRVNPDGSGLETFATGLRNPVFMTLNPTSKEVWAVEMGRDFLGDDLPPDEINILKEGKFYGWPFCYGKNIVDSSFSSVEADQQKCQTAEPSHIDLQAHSAPLGLNFFPVNSNWPSDYYHDLLVAYHGSWNRTEPTGYKVVRYHLDRQGNIEKVEDFITGWLTEDGNALGRPVDIKIQPDNKIYISDDKAGVIYLLEKK